MINLSNEVVVLKKGYELNSIVKNALDKTIRIISEKCSMPAVRKDLYDFVRVFTHQDTVIENNEAFVQFAYWFSSLNTEEVKLHRESIRKVIPKFKVTLSESAANNLRFGLKVLLLCLYKDEAVVLPYFFSRPPARWLDDLEGADAVYSDGVKLFRRLDNRAHTGSGSKLEYDTEERQNRRVFQTATKIILASSWHNLSSIDVGDLNAWRLAQLRDYSDREIKPFGKNISPIPLVQIIKTVHSECPNALSPDVKRWVEDITSGNSRVIVHGSTDDVVRFVISEKSSALDTVKKLLVRTGGATNFSYRAIDVYDVVGVMKDIGIDIKRSFTIWISAQENYFNFRILEKDKSHRSAIGRLNLYLFIYLPLWNRDNPDSVVVYPDEPAKFSSSVHYHCTCEGSLRPLSLIEFYRHLGFTENNQTITIYRRFFDHLIIYAPDLEGCIGLIQPVKRVPQSIKRAQVVKNIFPDGLLLLFVDYLYALESFSEWGCENSQDIDAEVSRCLSNAVDVDFSMLGYVPIVWRNGRAVPILSAPATLFSFVRNEMKVYYNPGSIRFSLLILETGARGQTAQWLDANMYDRVADRSSTEPQQLTSIILNTDKIQESPFIIVSIMRVLFMLDNQWRWRNSMIDAGCSGFAEYVYYDNSTSSKWGKILPLFAADPRTGHPITDHAYADAWVTQIYAFQQWLGINEIPCKPLVAFLPLHINSPKSSFKWEDWIRGLDESKVKVVTSDGGSLYGGPYCPLRLRPSVTPHGARASFITAMSTLLDPDALVFCTGQKESSLRRYNKGGNILREKLKGAFSGEAVEWCLSNTFADSISSSGILSLIKDSRPNGFSSLIKNLGLFSLRNESPGKFKYNGLELIAKESSCNVGAVYTHLCPFNFVCPYEVVAELGGERRCALCPYAIFSTNNIAQVAAERVKQGEELSRIQSAITDYTSGKKLSDAELKVLDIELKRKARDLIGWMTIEESLWTVIKMQQSDSSDAFHTGLRDDSFQLVHRYEVESDSSEGFLLRLGEVINFPLSNSQEFQYLTEKAVRLLLLKRKDVVDAVMMPSSFSTPVRLAGMIRSQIEFNELDLDEFVRLVYLESESWRDMLFESKSQNSISDSFFDLLG
ncbi:hypothetical protein HBN71_21520 [Pseudomonas lundensis]|uniref:hypothetical protein n=1 Tax=Pseudomonas TaxID=286 RepID=UPI000A6B1895|nr:MULTISPECIES: hypothetical protein [Pseudomonas]NNA13725.1 hypothetical protein [Pseudomonas lundensis]